MATTSRPLPPSSTRLSPRGACSSGRSTWRGQLPGPAFVVLDVVQVVGETAGSPYSNLVHKGELRTYVALNGKRIDYINRYITTSNETPERIRIPIPARPPQARQERDPDRADRHRQRPDLVRRRQHLD